MAKNKDWTGDSNSIYKTLGASNHTDKERQAEDFYATEPRAAELLLELEDFDENIWECACGQGDLSKVFEAAGHKVLSTDLVDRGCGTGGVDFLKCTEIFDGSIITNPPYKCYSSDTEIKTKRGWVKYTELKPDDMVLSVNINTLQLEWSNILQVIEKDVDEEMINFKHRFMDILVTKNHRMFTFSSSSEKPQIKNDDVYLAEDINSCSYIPLRGYVWAGDENKYFILDGCYVSDGQKEVWHPEIKINMLDWAEFFGLWVADGYCRHTLNPQGNQRYTIGVKQHRQSKERVLSIIKRLGFDVKEYKDGDKSNFEIHSKQLWNYLSQFGKSHDKFVPDDIKNSSISVLQRFIDGYTFGDSHIHKFDHSNTTVLSSVSKQLIEDVQEILLKLGYLTHISTNTYNKWASTLYKICFNKDKKTQTKLFYQKIPEYKHYVHYKGKVFCLQIEKNHFFLLRRNGHEFISGNCAKEFVEHALELVPDGHKVAMFLKLQFLEGKARRMLFEKYPPKTIYVASGRLLCAKNGEFEAMKAGGGSAVAYCWMVWVKGFKGDPVVKWFN